MISLLSSCGNEAKIDCGRLCFRVIWDILVIARSKLVLYTDQARVEMLLSSSTPQSSDAVKGTGATSTEHKSVWEGSSQYRHWRYSRERLLEQRTRINEAAVSAIKNAFETEEVSIA